MSEVGIQNSKPRPPATSESWLRTSDFPIASASSGPVVRASDGTEEFEDPLRIAPSDRRKWARYLYGVDWEDPSLYDTTVNLNLMGIPEAGRMIAAAAREKCMDFESGCEYQWRI